MRDPTSQQLPQKLKGRFWFPQNPNLVLSGDLVVSAPHNYDLELELPHYGLASPGYWESMLGKPIPAILGVSGEHGKLTCNDCGIYSSIASNDAPRSVSSHKLRLFAHRCFIGAHIVDQEPIRIRQFSAFFTGFNQWALAYDNELFAEEEIGLPKIKRSDVIDGFGRLKIFRAFSENGSIGDVGKQVRIRYWRPSFQPLEPTRIDDMLSTVRAFQFLLALLQGRAVGFNDLRAEMISADAAESEAGDQSIEILTMMTGYKQTFGSTRDQEFLLPFKEIGQCWPTLVSGWFKSMKSIAAPLNLYFAVLFVPDLFDEQKFLFLAQALEGYHRCTVKKEWVKFKKRWRI